ncbi:hypothetical protein GCM10011376_10850 [Nocardioides flavus (ex Wang et al. 2016)]|uniref:LppX_LprAFG lipoprotein n=1 Tax=Nocardioides flavus (ex Wang et al. 2016) TaxID=2058780 RepID=A0ABQ3HFT8_9ACTN|nr:hypothetical protein [Nocardioides flavus (ex Wang et al. 2016)]GHE16475.1 hypothetical protein GCM10011376_10850 [Nocardioides flavus (ex Wang et al. 2016)]
MRVTSLARRLGSAALVLTLGAGLAACSDDSSSTDSSSSATDESTDEGTDESTQDAEETEEPAEASLAELSAADFYPAVMEALQEAETFAFETTSDTGGQTQTMSGTARFGDDGMEMQATGSGAQAMDMILLDQAMYMKSPELGTGDKWLKIDLSDPNSLFGMIGKATDPEVMFKAMEEPKDLELVGSEEVDGVDTNHYRITLDPTQYVKAMEFPAAMADMLPKELVTEMWVDADNLPRKFTQTTESPAAGGVKPTTSTTEGTYSDFGTDVEIEAPPASEVTEQPGL